MGTMLETHIRPKTRFNWKLLFYQLSTESGHFTIILGEAISILFKQFYYSIFVLQRHAFVHKCRPRCDPISYINLFQRVS
jgi:hypothetical protein